MSKSFMSAIRGVVNAINEGAKDKTADGMTKDAEHFRKDLHTIQDSGMKHLVQKDSETKDYEKMFSGDVDRAPSNRGSYAPGEDVDKYVEYNEHLEIEEAKKAEKHDKDCECEDCASDDKEEVKEGAAPRPSPEQRAALDTRLASQAKMKAAGPSPMPQSGVKPAGLFGTTTKMQVAAKAASNIKRPEPAKAPGGAKGVNAAVGGMNPTDDQRRAGFKIGDVRNQAYGKAPTSQGKAGPTPNTGASSASPVPTASQPKPAGGIVSKPAAPAAKPSTPAAVNTAAQRAAAAPTSMTARKGSTVWGMAKQDIQNKRAQAAASVPDAGQGEISMARRSSVAAPAVAKRTSEILKANKMTQGSARRMQVGRTIKVEDTNEAALIEFFESLSEEQIEMFLVAEGWGNEPGSPLDRLSKWWSGGSSSSSSSSGSKTSDAIRNMNATTSQQGGTGGAGPNRGLGPKPAAPSAAAKAPKPKLKPAAPQSAAPKAKPAAPQAAKPQAAKPKLSPLQQQMKRSKTGRDDVAGPSHLRQSFEFEVNGNSYLVSETHASAIAAFVEKYGILEGTAGEFIHKEMEHPEKLTAKGKKQKIKQALAIYYSKKRRGENP